MKGKKNNVVNDFMNNLSNNVNFKINKVDSMVDMLSVVLIVIILALVGMDVKIPQESKMAFLLALIILVSCYSIDIAIVVAVIAIIYVLIQNNNATENFESCSAAAECEASDDANATVQCNDGECGVVTIPPNPGATIPPNPGATTLPPAPAPPPAKNFNIPPNPATQFPATQFPANQFLANNSNNADSDPTSHDIVQDRKISILYDMVNPQQDLDNVIKKLKVDNSDLDPKGIAYELVRLGFSKEKISKFLTDEKLKDKEIDYIINNIMESYDKPYGTV